MSFHGQTRVPGFRILLYPSDSGPLQRVPGGADALYSGGRGCCHLPQDSRAPESEQVAPGRPASPPHVGQAAPTLPSRRPGAHAPSHRQAGSCGPPLPLHTPLGAPGAARRPGAAATPGAAAPHAPGRGARSSVGVLTDGAEGGASGGRGGGSRRGGVGG